jgi:hypothetical protein
MHFHLCPDYRRIGCGAGWTVKNLPTFRRKIHYYLGSLKLEEEISSSTSICLFHGYVLVHPAEYIFHKYRLQNVKSSTLLLNTEPLLYINNYTLYVKLTAISCFT